MSRFWPMVAESWAVVTIPAMGIFGEAAGRYVGALHLLVGYAVLGVLVVSRKTRLTRRTTRAPDHLGPGPSYVPTCRE